MSPDPMQRLWARVLRAGRFECGQAGVDRVWSAARTEGRIAALSRRWAAAGVGPGEVLMFRGSQGLAAFTSFWAVQRLGAVWLPVDPAWPVARLQAFARVAGVGRLVDATSQPVDPGFEVWRIGDDDSDGDDDAAGEPAGFGGGEWVAIAGEAPAALLPTSGSTGGPKLVQLARAALVRSGVLAAHAFGWQAGERLLNLAEPHTMSGLRNAMITAPLAGMRWLVSSPASRTQVFELFEQIGRCQPQRVVAAPLLVRQANLWADRLPIHTWHSVRALYCTGADLDAREVQVFHAREGVPVLNYYGLTETVGLCLSQRLSSWQPDDDSLGRPVGCAVRLVDEQGQVLPPGSAAAGELQVRQRRPSGGYWRDAAATRALFDGGWLRTGDLARIDASQRVRLVGRRAHFIKTAGTEKVSPVEVEEALQSHRAVLEAAVCGVRGAGGAERVAALVVPREGVATPQAGQALQRELILHTAQMLGAARAPSVLRFVKSLPRAANGKLLRPQLPEMFDT